VVKLDLNLCGGFKERPVTFEHSFIVVEGEVNGILAPSRIVSDG
jgi:hypothetical protein